MNSLSSTNTFIPRTLRTGKCPESLRFYGKSVRRKGQTTVELALILLPFFAILFAIIDYAQIYFYENSLQNALRESTRFATAGRVIQSYAGGVAQTTHMNGVSVPLAINDNEGRVASRNECIRYWFLSNCIIQIPTNNITIISASSANGQPYLSSDGRTLLGGYSVTTNGGVVSTNISAVTSKGPGGANDYIQVTATNVIQTITPLFSYLGGYSHAGAFTYPVRVSAIVKNEPALLNFLHTNVYSDEYP